MARVEVRFDGVSRGARAAARDTVSGIDSVGTAATRNQRRVHGLGREIRQSMTGAVSSIARVSALVGGVGGGGLAGSVIFAGFKFNDLKQRAQIAFETMLGSGQKARRFLDDLAKFAEKTPFEFKELIPLSQKLMTAGFEANKIIPILTRVGDAVAAMGGDPQAMESTIRAITQIQAKGRVMAEEMMQLNEAGTFSWRALSKEIGVSVPAAMKLVEKGSVSADAFMAAFVANTDQRFGGMSERISHTFGGMLSTIKDRFTQTSGTAMRPFFDLATDGMEAIIRYTSRPEFTAGVERLAQWLRDVVVPKLREMVEWIVEHRGDIVGVFRSAGEVVRGFAGALADIRTALAPLVGAIGGVDDAAKLAFGAVMIGRVQGLLATLVGPGGAGGKASMLGGLRLLTATPWVIGISLAIMNRDKITEYFNSLTDRMPGPKGGTVTTPEQYAQLPDWAKRKIGAANAPTVTPGAGAVRSPDSSVRARGMLQAPAAFRGTHVTDGLDWNNGQRTATDIMAHAGTPVGAPEDGVVVRHGGAQGGKALYFKGNSGTMYWLGHIENPAPVGTQARKGAVICTISADHPRPHLHIDRKVGAKVTPTVTGGTDTGFGSARDLVGGGKGSGGAGRDRPDPADRGELQRARFGLKWVASRTDDVKNPEARGALRKRIRWINTDLADANTEQEASKITERVQKLKDRLADVLGSQSGRQRDAAKRLGDQVAGAAKNAVDRASQAVTAARGRFSQSWGRMADMAGRIFDAKTRQLVRNARANVMGFEIGEGEQTPGEKKLEGFREGREKMRMQQRRDEINRRISELSAPGAEETDADRARREQELLDAQRELQDMQFDEQERALEKQAGTERTAADQALAAKREQIETERALLKEQLELRLEAIRQSMEDGTITAEEGLVKLRDLFQSPQWRAEFADAGKLLGSTYNVAFNQAIKSSLKDAGRMQDSLGKQADAEAGMGGNVNLNDPNQLINRRRSGFARGGKVPGMYIGRDSVPALLTPGETVIDRDLTRRLEAIAAGGLGGSAPTVNVTVTGNTLLGSERQVALEIAKVVEPQIRRIVGSSYPYEYR